MQPSGNFVDGRVVEISAVKEESYGIHIKFACQANGVSYASSEVYPERNHHVNEKNDILGNGMIVLRVNSLRPEKAVCLMGGTPVPFMATTLGFSFFRLGDFSIGEGSRDNKGKGGRCILCF